MVQQAPTLSEYSQKEAPRASVIRRKLAATLTVPEVGVLVPLIVLTGVFAIFSDAMLKPSFIGSMLRQISFVGLIAIGEAVLMVAGELDLSVGSVAGLCAVLSASLMTRAEWPVGVALIAGLACGALAGLINGVLAIVFGVPAFIATLGMLYIARGVDYLITHGIPVSIPDSVRAFGEAQPLGLSWTFFIFIFLAMICDLSLRFTTFGRKVYATGGNREVARVAGINTSLVKVNCYLLTGLLSGLAGIMTMASYRGATPEIGIGWELTVIAGVVIGGISLFGGVGTVAGAFLGMLIMQVVSSGLPLTGAEPHWQTVAVGVIMIIAVAFDLLRRRSRA